MSLPNNMLFSTSSQSYSVQHYRYYYFYLLYLNFFFSAIVAHVSELPSESKLKKLKSQKLLFEKIWWCQLVFVWDWLSYWHRVYGRLPPWALLKLFMNSFKHICGRLFLLLCLGWGYRLIADLNPCSKVKILTHIDPFFNENRHEIAPTIVLLQLLLFFILNSHSVTSSCPTPCERVKRSSAWRYFARFITNT